MGPELEWQICKLRLQDIVWTIVTTDTVVAVISHMKFIGDFQLLTAPVPKLAPKTSQSTRKAIPPRYHRVLWQWLNGRWLMHGAGAGGGSGDGAAWCQAISQLTVSLVNLSSDQHRTHGTRHEWLQCRPRRRVIWFPLTSRRHRRSFDE